MCEFFSFIKGLIELCDNEYKYCCNVNVIIIWMNNVFNRKLSLTSENILNCIGRKIFVKPILKIIISFFNFVMDSRNLWSNLSFIYFNWIVTEYLWHQ